MSSASPCPSRVARPVRALSCGSHPTCRPDEKPGLRTFAPDQEMPTPLSCGHGKECGRPPVAATGGRWTYTTRPLERARVRAADGAPRPTTAATAVPRRSGGCLDGIRYTVEMTPAWGVPDADRGVAMSGPVLLATLGRSRFFQYEVRRWRDGVIPDRRHAVESPVRVSADADRAAELLAAVPRCPALIWGRDELGVGEMWNSNSIIAFLLATSGHDLREVRPPQGGRAPGWAAGLHAARGGTGRS